MALGSLPPATVRIGRRTIATPLRCDQPASRRASSSAAIVSHYSLPPTSSAPPLCNSFRMSSALITKLRMGDWSESLHEEFGDGSKITGAEVPLQDGTDGLESGWFSMLSYYRPDGTSEFT